MADNQLTDHEATDMAKVRFTKHPEHGKVELEPFLYEHPRKPFFWRYNCPEQNKTVDLFNFLSMKRKKLTPEEANEYAALLNEKHGRAETKFYSTKKGSLVQWAKKFIEHETARRKEAGKDKTKRFHGDKLYLEKFSEQMGHYHPTELTGKLISDWWHSQGEFDKPAYYKTPLSQRNQRYILKLFFAYLMQHNAVNLSYNPFNANGDAPLEYSKRNSKYRKRLTLQQFFQIKELAEKDGCMWLVNAMELSLFTGMRRGDILNLQFGKHFSGNEIRTSFKKSVAQLGEERAVHVVINLKEHEQVRKIVNRAMQTKDDCKKSIRTVRNRKACRITEDRPALHVIHCADNNLTLDGGRTHYSQITEDMLTRKFKFYRDQLECFKDYQPRQLPTFHEIRALHVHINKKMGRSIEEIQKNVGHQDTKMTEGYASGHEIEWHELSHPLDNDALMQHLAKEA